MILENNCRFLNTVNQVSASKSLDELLDVIENLRAAYCVANIVYHAVFIPESAVLHPILLLTYDPEWVTKYKDNDYFKIDPVVVSGVKGFLPLDWSTLDHDAPGARSFFKEADRYEVGRQGLTLPVRGVGGERALFTITANMNEAEWASRKLLYMKEFQIVAHYVHERAVELSGFRSERIIPDLSRRETQCLEYSARGYSPKQIADRLGISDRVVHAYLRSACGKLRCASVHQAVAKMVMFEVIRPLK